MPASAIVGHTGFVGGNLVAQHSFAELYNSRNLEVIDGRAFDLLVVSAMPAAMWIANRDPAADRANLDRLLGSLLTVRADRVVVMSTVAVYPRPIDVDETTSIDEAGQTPYGRHRLMLERALSERFARTTVIRLPALYGPGLKKNALYDLLHNHETHKINAASRYQFYDLGRLWADTHRAIDAECKLVNFATAPLTVREIAREVLGFEFDNDNGAPPADFDVRSRHAAKYGGVGGYLQDRDQVINGLRLFVADERRRGGTS